MRAKPVAREAGGKAVTAVIGEPVINKPVIPAQAGIHGGSERRVDPGLRRDDVFLHRYGATLRRPGALVAS